MRFRLRTLMIVVALVAVFCGYEMNWVRRRRALIATLEASFVDRHPTVKRQEAAGWWRFQLHSSERRAPQLLSLFGEEGIGRIVVVIPDTDTFEFGHGYYIQRSEPVYERTRRLFPEAELELASHFTTGANGLTVGWHRTEPIP